MTYQNIDSSMFRGNAEYRFWLTNTGEPASFMSGGLTIRLEGTVSPDGDLPANEAEADAKFQRLLDLISSSPDFTVYGAEKVYDSSSVVTVTEVTPTEE